MKTLLLISHDTFQLKILCSKKTIMKNVNKFLTRLFNEI